MQNFCAAEREREREWEQEQSENWNDKQECEVARCCSVFYVCEKMLFKML